MRKTILGIMVIASVVGFLIWGGYFNSGQEKPANIFSLEYGLHGKWSDVKHEHAVYFFSDYTFFWQENNSGPVIGKYKIIQTNKKNLFLKLNTGKMIIINKFIIPGSYNENDRMLSFTLESIDQNDKGKSLTLRRKPKQTE